MRILIDTNILIDIGIADPRFGLWSKTRLIGAALTGNACINAIVMSEFASGWDDSARAADFVSGFDLVWAELDQASALRAGEAHRQYRKRGGVRTRTLPDFLIGAHAEVCDMTILTRDADVYTSYFPKVPLITPESHPL